MLIIDSSCPFFFCGKWRLNSRSKATNAPFCSSVQVPVVVRVKKKKK